MQPTRVAFFSAVVFALAACAASGPEHPAATETSDSASITGHWIRDGMSTTWEGHRLESIDGTKVSYGLAFNPYVVTVKVEPGTRKLIALTLFNVGTAQYSATVPMEVTIKPRTAYVINAALSGQYIDAWLEDSGSGERASENFRGECKKSVAGGIGFKQGPCVEPTQ